MSITATTHDPLLAKVIHRRLEAACEEAAITLNRTSGSPIVTEANDFSTSLLSVTGDVIAFTSYLPPHFVSAINCVRDLLANVDLDTVKPGDHFAANDPYTAHPLHSADPSVITPVFGGGELVAWAYSSVHVLDVGGLTPGGWIPGSYDRYGEGFLFPITKVVHEGVWDDQFVKFYLANVRMAESLNDLRSCVAANNTTARRLEEVFERYGAGTVKDYAEYNIELSEAHARQRIAELPDGTYTAHDWVEYDGHGIETMSRLSVSVTVRGDELLIDLSDSPPEANCFINATRAALLGWVLGDLIRALMPDLPINSGVIRPLKVIKAEPGTMLNPSKNAATSAGHMESGTKVMRAFHGALHKAIGLSANPEVRSRMAGLGANVAPHNVVFGLTEEGAPLMWVSFDSLGTGLGAQSNIDGRECGCYEDMTGSRMLDIELEETAPTLHYFRRLCPNSGGHGYRRGGMGIDTAWRTLGMDRTQMTVFSNVTRVPSRAPGGGYPGGGTGNLIFERGIEHDSPTDLGACFIEEDLTEGSTLPPSHGTNLQMDDDDITRTYGAGGSGIGDPLFREPWRVAEDLENQMITPDVVGSVYGVVLTETGEVDEAATAERRREIRAERLGAEPSREPSPMESYRPPLTVAGESLVCSHCDGSLGPADGNWKEHAKARRWPLVELAEKLGAKVRPTGVIELETVELVCPSCGSLLEVDTLEAGEDLYQDIRLGHTRSEAGEAF
ncbi:MAG: hydantoinase B/oxoprolinase family protein [Solirubrobacterales bacterium]